MTNHLKSKHNIDCDKEKSQKKRRVDSMKQKLITEYPNIDSQSPSGSQKSQSQSQEIEEAGVSKRKRDLQPIKAIIQYCCRELYDISIINKPATTSLMKKMSCLRPNSDVSENTAIEELSRMTSTLGKEIKKDMTDIKTLSVSITKYTINEHVRKVLLFASFLDEEWNSKNFFLAMGTEDAKTSNKFPIKLVRSSLEKFEVCDPSISIHAVSCHRIVNARNIEKMECFGHVINNVLHASEIQDGFVDLYDRLKQSLRTTYFDTINEITSSKKKLAKLHLKHVSIT